MPSNKKQTYEMGPLEEANPSKTSSCFPLRTRILVLIFLLLICIAAIIVLAVLLAKAKAATAAEVGPEPDTSCYSPECLKAASHIVELLNKSAADPCEDFYTFACSNFPRVHPLNPAENEVSTFQLIHKKNMDRLRHVVEAVPSTEDPEHFEFKAKAFYVSCLDHFKRMGLKGGPFLEKVVDPSGGWWVLWGDGDWPPGNYSFQEQLEKVHVDFWTDVFFTFWVGPDYVDRNKATIQIFLGGHGLNFWLYRHPASVAAYREYMEAVGRLLIRDAGLNVSEDEKMERLNTFVSDALYVETELADISASSWGFGPYADNRRKLSSLNDDSNGVLDWVSLFSYMFNVNSTTLVTPDTYVVVHQQEYVQNFTKWVSDLHPANRTRILNNYMIWRLADKYSRFLSWEYLHPYYEFKMTRRRTQEIPPAWEYCMKQLTNVMEDAVGALFVRDHFVDPNRDTAHEITDYVKKALLDSLKNTDHWMSSDTREAARQKVTESLIKLGYPDHMADDRALQEMYQSLTIRRDDYFGNILSFCARFREDSVHAFTHPNDDSRWAYPTYSMAVEYYSPLKELIVPAGTLQFPIFDHSSPRYMNFGSMGAMVGRELTHAVDEFGSEYYINSSHSGDWWSVNTTERYRTVRRCIIAAYNSYGMGPFPGIEEDEIYVSSNYAPRALSESSGVRLAYKGYQQWSEKNGQEGTIPGHNFTNNMMFFISYAQTFCSNHKVTYRMVSRLRYGSEVTDRVRVNGALGQLQEFQDAFHCPVKSHMVAEKRCDLY